MSQFGSIDTQDLVSSKENIQPLRRGRDTSILSAALQAETDNGVQQELEKQRNEFEIKLRSNTSDDPLADYCNYIHWIEQSFPKQSREGKLNVVLQKCLNKFKDNKQYMNDLRFVKLCIKYAELEDNTVELLSQIHRHGIGVLCAELYIAWAEKFAVGNCFKKANAIYERGLKCSAQPLQLLQESYQNFQVFLVRKMLNERETFQPTVMDSNPVDHRQPYNILQTVKAGQKEIIPSIRIGSNVIGTAGKLQGVGQTENKHKSNTLVKIFEDSEGTPLCEPAAKIEKIHSKKTISKENTVKPGTWNNKKNKNVPFKVETSANLPFQVHRDQEDSEEIRKKTKAVPSTVLKAHRVKPSYEDENFINAPLFYPEPFDPNIRPMYCKEQVYAGGLEFQFEELRAIQYRRNREVIKYNCTYETAGEALEEKQLPPEINSDTHSKTNNEKTKQKSNNIADKKVKNTTEAQRKTIFNNLVPTVELEVRGSLKDNMPNTDYSMNQTIHTKEALSEMQQLWFSKPASPVPITKKTVKPVAKSILKPSKPCFSLYVDESCLENFKPPEKPRDLTLKVEKQSQEGDEEGESSQKDNLKSDKENPIIFGGVRKKTGLKNNIQCSTDNKENCFKENFDAPKVSSDLKTDDDDKENGVPEDYCGPIGKSTRKVSGILTPAENVEIADLSDEEVEVDEGDAEEVVLDEQDEARGHDYSSIIRCNTTAITETWNFTKGFQFPRGESTPNIRKSLHNRADFDDSAFLPHPMTNETDMKTDENSVDSKIGTDKCSIIEKKTNGEIENVIKNLSVIAETSREYRSSSSASSGASTLALRQSKNFPYTPSDARNSKYSLTASQSTLHKAKLQNYTSYEASSESSQTVSKTPVAHKKDTELNITINLMQKLNAIDSLSISDTNAVVVKNSAKECLSKKETSENSEINKTAEEMIDPFSEEVIERLLQEVDFPQKHHDVGYYLLSDVEIPALKLGSSLTLGAFTFDIKKVLGEGSYARIFRIANINTGDILIAKYQKPPFPWEFYIAREIQARIKDTNQLGKFMNIEYAYFFKNASILLTRPVEFGDLLAVINKMQQVKMMCQSLAMHFTCQILEIIEILHSCKIIHGDIKPDNFLLRRYNNKLQLQLIDFGRSVDMTQFQEGTTFTRVVTTEGLTTVEMKLGKPWTYQIDYYGAANCGHALLFGDYMRVIEKGGVWNIAKTIPRYWARSEWRNFFTSLINVESCSNLPNLSDIRMSFEGILRESSDIEFSLTKLNNILNNR